MEWPVRPRPGGQTLTCASSCLQKKPCPSSSSHKMRLLGLHTSLPGDKAQGSAPHSQSHQSRLPGSAVPCRIECGTPTEPRSARSQAHSQDVAGKEVTTVSALGRWSQSCSRRESRPGALSSTVPVTLTAQGWPGTTPVGPGPHKVHTSCEPQWEGGRAADQHAHTLHSRCAGIVRRRGGSGQHRDVRASVSPLCRIGERNSCLRVKPSSQVSGPGSTGGRDTKTTRNSRGEPQNGSTEWLPEASHPTVRPRLLCGTLHAPPDSGPEFHRALRVSVSLRP